MPKNANKNIPTWKNKKQILQKSQNTKFTFYQNTKSQNHKNKLPNHKIKNHKIKIPGFSSIKSIFIF